MNRIITFCFISVMILVAFSSCSGDGDNGSSMNGEVTIATDSVVQTGSFKKSNGEVCDMKVTLVASYPQAFKDTATAEKLKQLFTTHLLKDPQGTTSVKDAMQRYAQSIVSQDTPSSAGDTHAVGDSLSIDVDEIDIDSFEPRIVIKVVYNDNDLITFCKEETISKNGQNTSVSHHYVSFDLQEMKRVALSDMFSDDSLNKLTAKLKEKLMDDKGASDEDELNDLGYFNLPNLSVNGNFFFTSRGVTWSYDSSVIAVASVGEPTINIDYDDLEPFYCDNSILKRM